jgi:hypothetical protein
MVKQASNVRKRLRRFLTADPGRFAGGSAVSDPLGLLAVERERLAVLRSPQHDGSPQTAATANQGTGSTFEALTGPRSWTRPRSPSTLPTLRSVKRNLCPPTFQVNA